MYCSVWTQKPYEIALEQAKARLATVGQTIGANTAGVTSAQERLTEAQASGTTCSNSQTVY